MKKDCLQGDADTRAIEQTSALITQTGREEQTGLPLLQSHCTFPPSLHSEGLQSGK